MPWGENSIRDFGPASGGNDNYAILELISPHWGTDLKSNLDPIVSRTRTGWMPVSSFNALIYPLKPDVVGIAIKTEKARPFMSGTFFFTDSKIVTVEEDDDLRKLLDDMKLPGYMGTTEPNLIYGARFVKRGNSFAPIRSPLGVLTADAPEKRTILEPEDFVTPALEGREPPRLIFK